MKPLTAALLLTAMAGLCSGCSEDTPVQPEDLSIFPLAVGNQWTYHYVEYDLPGSGRARDTMMLRVDRDTMIAGEQWFVIVLDSSHRPFLILKQRDDGIWRYLNWRDTALLYFKYPALKGDQYDSESPGEWVRVAETAVRRNVPAGSYTCYDYYFENEDLHFLLAPGVGIINLEYYARSSDSTVQPWLQELTMLADVKIR